MLNGIAFTVVGVAPEGFTGPAQFSRFDFYAPLMMWPGLMGDPSVQPLDARGFRRLMMRGRLKSGVTLSLAQTELMVCGRDLERAYPDTNRDRRMVVRTELQDRIADASRLAILLAMLGLISAAVLVVACGNVAGLLASRAPVRAREIALRLAIGASRSRIVQQLLVESLLIATMGAALGLGVGSRRRRAVPTDSNPDRLADRAHI